MNENVKLRTRTTYINGNGKLVHIAGLTGKTLEGQPLYWSIEGDHYSENGRLILMRFVAGKGYESFITDANYRSIVCEDISDNSSDWWKHVKTERMP